MIYIVRSLMDFWMMLKSMTLKELVLSLVHVTSICWVNY